MSTMFTTDDDGSEDEVRNVTLTLRECTVTKTEDFGIDELYVAGHIHGVSPTQGEVVNKFITKDIANVVRFSEDEEDGLPRTQQLLPKTLFQGTVASDTSFRLILMLVDAENKELEEDSFLRDLADFAGEAFRTLPAALATFILPGVPGAAALLKFVGGKAADLLAAAIEADDDDLLGKFDTTFGVARTGLRQVPLRADADGADYAWGYDSLIIAPEEETENATGDTGTPVRPEPPVPPKDDRMPTGDGDGIGGGAGGSGTPLGEDNAGDDEDATGSDTPSGDNEAGGDGDDTTRPDTPLVPPRRNVDDVRRLRPVGEREEVIAVGTDLRRTFGTVGTIEDRNLVRDDVTVTPVGRELGTGRGADDAPDLAGFPNGRRIMIDVVDGLDVILRPSPVRPV